MIVVPNQPGQFLIQTPNGARLIQSQQGLPPGAVLTVAAPSTSTGTAQGIANKSVSALSWFLYYCPVCSLSIPSLHWSIGYLLRMDLETQVIFTRLLTPIKWAWVVFSVLLVFFSMLNSLQLFVSIGLLSVACNNHVSWNWRFVNTFKAVATDGCLILTSLARFLSPYTMHVICRQCTPKTPVHWSISIYGLCPW